MAKRSKKSAGCFLYLVAFAMVSLGVCCPAVPGLYRYFRQPYTKQFLIPGSIEVQLPRGGDYTLWHEYRTIFNGKSYTASTNLPVGLKVVFKNCNTGSNVVMEPHHSAAFTSNLTAGRSVGHFTISTPGRYIVSVSGPIKQPLVFSFREDWLLEVLGQTFLLLMVGGLLALIGIVMLIVIFIWRRFR